MVNGPAGTRAIPSGGGGADSMEMEGAREGCGAAPLSTAGATEDASGGASSWPGEGPGSCVEHAAPTSSNPSAAKDLPLTRLLIRETARLEKQSPVDAGRGKADPVRTLLPCPWRRDRLAGEAARSASMSLRNSG